MARPPGTKSEPDRGGPTPTGMEVALDSSAPRLRPLVDAAVDGDRDAFRALVEPVVPGALGVATIVTGSPADAADAVQDALLSAWRGLPGLRDADAFPAWFRQHVVRAAMRTAKRRGRVLELDMDAARRPGCARSCGRPAHARTGVRPAGPRRPVDPHAPPLPRPARGRDRGAPLDPDRHRQVARPCGHAPAARRVRRGGTAMSDDLERTPAGRPGRARPGRHGRRRPGARPGSTRSRPDGRPAGEARAGRWPRR